MTTPAFEYPWIACSQYTMDAMARAILVGAKCLEAATLAANHLQVPPTVTQLFFGTPSLTGEANVAFGRFVVVAIVISGAHVWYPLLAKKDIETDEWYGRMAIYEQCRAYGPTPGSIPSPRKQPTRHQRRISESC